MITKQLILGDNLEKLKTIGSDSIGLIYLDWLEVRVKEKLNVKKIELI